MYDGIMTFALDNGSFLDANWQTGELEYNEYATGQCFQALVAYSRMVNGQSALFDLSDAAVAPRPKPEDEKPESGSSSSQASSEPSGAPGRGIRAAGFQCGRKPEFPKTGDMGLVSIAAVGLIAAAAAVVLYRKK